MSNNSERLEILFPKEDEKYFSFSDKDILETYGKFDYLDGFEGILISSPQEIDLIKHECLPVLWTSQTSALRNWKVEKMRNSFLIISDIDRDCIRVYNAYSGGKRFNMAQIPKSSVGKPPEVGEVETYTADVKMLECKSIIGEQLKSGVLVITLMQYDWLSNSVRVKLFKNSQGHSEITGYAPQDAAEINKKNKEALKNSKNAAIVVPSTITKKLTERGTILSISSQYSPKDMRWIAHGYIKIPIAHGAVVDSGKNKSYYADLPGAVITAMIIINKLDNTEPVWITVRMPIQREKDCKAGDIVESSFTIDLKIFNKNFSTPGTYQVYLAAGEYIAGPYVMNVQ